MEGIGLLLFIVMIIASLIEQASRKGKQGKTGQRPPPRWQQGRLPQGDVPPDRSGRLESPRPRSDPVLMPDADARSAADMVAEDFWRELTGQPPRPRPASPPPPAHAEASSWDEEAVLEVEAPPPETAPTRTSASWEYRRPDVVHEAPVVVSLEAPLQDPDVRHASYHRRLAAAQAAKPPVAAAVPAPESKLVRRLRQSGGLRESVIMAEVFGRPRGLEEYSPDR